MVKKRPMAGIYLYILFCVVIVTFMVIGNIFYA